jgi:hypothetical protein
MSHCEPFRVQFEANGMRFIEYRYPPSVCFPDGKIMLTHMLDVSIGYPPRLRVIPRDVLFVSKVQEEEMRTFAKEHQVPIVDRYDPWTNVLEPFLDTSLAEADKRRSMALLKYNGISENQVREWRERFKRAMRSYNFDSGLWEWVTLGATDLLDAHFGILASWRFKLSKNKFSALYRTVIDVLFDAKEVNTEAIRAML